MPELRRSRRISIMPSSRPNTPARRSSSVQQRSAGLARSTVSGPHLPRTTVESVASPDKKKTSPAKSMRSPDKNKTSPAKSMRSPDKKKTSSAKSRRSPDKKKTSPAKVKMSPAKKRKSSKSPSARRPSPKRRAVKTPPKKVVIGASPKRSPGRPAKRTPSRTSSKRLSKSTTSVRPVESPAPMRRVDSAVVVLETPLLLKKFSGMNMVASNGKKKSTAKKVVLVVEDDSPEPKTSLAIKRRSPSADGSVVTSNKRRRVVSESGRGRSKKPDTPAPKKRDRSPDLMPVSGRPSIHRTPRTAGTVSPPSGSPTLKQPRGRPASGAGDTTARRASRSPVTPPKPRTAALEKTPEFGTPTGQRAPDTAARAQPESALRRVLTRNTNRANVRRSVHSATSVITALDHNSPWQREQERFNSMTVTAVDDVPLTRSRRRAAMLNNHADGAAVGSFDGASCAKDGAPGVCRPLLRRMGGCLVLALLAAMTLLLLASAALLACGSIQQLGELSVCQQLQLASRPLLQRAASWMNR